MKTLIVETTLTAIIDTLISQWNPTGNAVVKTKSKLDPKSENRKKKTEKRKKKTEKRKKTACKTVY